MIVHVKTIDTCDLLSLVYCYQKYCYTLYAFLDMILIFVYCSRFYPYNDFLVISSDQSLHSQIYLLLLALVITGDQRYLFFLVFAIFLTKMGSFCFIFLGRKNFCITRLDFKKLIIYSNFNIYQESFFIYHSFLRLFNEALFCLFCQ